MNVYEIFTKITMQNAVSGVMATIARDVLHLEGGIGRLSKAFGELGRTSVAMAGGLSAAGGLGIAYGLKSAVEHAKELGHQLVQVQRTGISAAEYAKAYDVIMKLPSAVPGTTSAGGAKVWAELFSVLGADETTKNLDRLSAFTMSLANTKGIGFNEAAENLRDMVRSADLLRKFVDPKTHQVSHERLEHFLEIGARVITATRGVVGPATWLALAQQGGPVLSTMSDEGLMTMGIVAQYMKGLRAGTALTSAFQQFGGGIMRQSSAEEAAALGLIGPGSLGEGGGPSWARGAHGGGHWRPGRGAGRIIFDEKTLDTPFARALQTDPAIAAQILEQQLLAHGFDTVEKQTKELFKVFGRATTQRLFSDLLGNLPQLLEERHRMLQAIGITAGNQLANTQDPEQAMRNLNAAYEDMIGKISLPGAIAAIPTMKTVGDFFLGMSNWAVKPENAEILANIGIGLGYLSAFMISGGTAAILGALGPAGWLVGGLTALGIATYTYQDSIKNFLFGETGTLSTIQKAITGMFQGIIDWIASYIPAWMKKTNYEGGAFGGGGIIGTSFGGRGGGVVGGGGGRFNGLGLGPGTAARGTLLGNQKLAYAAAIAEGLPPTAAKALVANLSGESLRNPADYHWDVSHMAQGVGQWDPARAAAIKAHFGKFPKDMTVGEQTAASIWEMKTKYPATYRALMGGGSPESMIDALVRDYERPRDKAGAINQRQRYYRGLPSGIANSPHERPAVIHNTMYLDGEVVHRSVVRRLVRGMTHPTTAPYHDGSRHWTPPDAGLVGV